MARRWLPDNVTAFKDKCGRTRYRFRKKGLPQYLFRHDPGTPGFMEEYNSAKKAAPVIKTRHAEGSFHVLIESYYRSKNWVRMMDSTKQARRGVIERFRAKHGDKPVNRLEARHVDRWMSDMADTPHAANTLRKALIQLMKHAILLGWRRDNPALVIDAIETDSEGFHCWTEEEIAQYDERWPLGTRERLAKELLLYTSLRRGDMVKVGRQHRNGGKLVLRHSKNRSDTIITILPPLAAALDSLDSEHLTYLVTQLGKPFTAAGFGNWFRERCNMAGLPHCTAHGLRKAMARRLAESGATYLQGRAVTGHRSDAMFAHYAAKANATAMAEEALEQMAERIGIGGKPVDMFAKNGDKNG
ncbi:tyrosine-type recombinase/integrase [Sphingobium fuliginis]|jgi:integrase|uniref:Tyrosine-type recombinase/integrase n=1 Tax=Sphingobium fuliginis (strain ATCC 27551) TaxID=336203 RepID=A0A7M2GGT8_SPHSA|nr:tyrosine-type recombinase/integrase [Sphingobium fuliginis]QOT71934.1 tyrosine-type recombinase/integrase [Sphingobium fuliginis]